MWGRQRRGEGATDPRFEGPIHGEGLRSPEVRWKGGSSDQKFVVENGEVMGGTRPWKLHGKGWNMLGFFSDEKSGTYFFGNL